tara:strand:- start:13 stop:594 length:582 start_codon:yes stop_codon:yes gene_type:complete
MLKKMNNGPRISFIDPKNVSDNKMLNVIKRSAVEGTPRAESQAIRAKVPSVFWSFQNTWESVFINGITDHKIKELCRVYVSQSVNCNYCGNQRSNKALKDGLLENKFSELLNFENSEAFDQKTKAALSLAEAITWDLPTEDAFWERLYKFYSEEEIIELGYFIGFTMGQQRFNRTLNIDSVLGQTGFEPEAKV